MVVVDYPDWASPMERYHRRRNAEQAAINKKGENYDNTLSWRIENERRERSEQIENERRAREEDLRGSRVEKIRQEQSAASKRAVGRIHKEAPLETSTKLPKQETRPEPKQETKIVANRKPSYEGFFPPPQRFVPALVQASRFFMAKLKYSIYRTTRKPKMDLPMILKGETIISTPDSGSEDNIISREVVSALGLQIDDATEHQKEYRMGNNRIVKALGLVRTTCTFAKDTEVELDCLFYVFNTLITPLIMGMAFVCAIFSTLLMLRGICKNQCHLGLANTFPNHLSHLE